VHAVGRHHVPEPYLALHSGRRTEQEHGLGGVPFDEGARGRPHLDVPGPGGRRDDDGQRAVPAVAARHLRGVEALPARAGLEDGVVQIWTGCIFSLPAEWGLHLRSPVNLPRQPYYVMEAVIEADWLQYDIWLNLAFDRPGEVARLRREGWPPIAQIVPVRRDSYDARWSLDEEMMNRNSDDADRAFRFFVEYNRKKFAGEGTEPIPFSNPPATKDPALYFKERKRLFGDRKN